MSWVRWSEEEVLRRAPVVVVLDGESVVDDERDLLMSAVQDWVDATLPRGALALTSSRAAAVEYASQTLLDSATKSGAPCSVFVLGGESVLILAQRNAVQALGKEGVVRRAHYASMCRAVQRGQQVDDKTLAGYRAEFEVPQAV